MADLTKRDSSKGETGTDSSVTRRDFLGSTLLASGSLLVQGLTPAQLLAAQDDFTGYGGVGDYRASNGNTFDVLTAGHKMRDRGFHPESDSVVDTRETYDCVVVGGGISGLLSLP